MQGSGGSSSNNNSSSSETAAAEVDELAGVIPRMNASLFARIADEKAGNSNVLFLVTCSYFEIYNEVRLVVAYACILAVRRA
jgi:Na+/serine symporter